MHWLILALASAITFSIADLFGKLSSDKLHPYLGAFLINFFSALTVFIPLIFFYLKGEPVFEVKPKGISFAIIAGITVGLASLFLFKTFASGVNLSISVPVVRTAIVVIASVLGILILKEGINVKLIAGLFLSIIGIYLISTAK